MKNTKWNTLLSGLILCSLLLTSVPGPIAHAQQTEYLTAEPDTFQVPSLVAQDDMVIGALQHTRLMHKDSSPTDKFGYGVSISGDTAVIGARNESVYHRNELLTNARLQAESRTQASRPKAKRENAGRTPNASKQAEGRTRECRLKAERENAGRRPNARMQAEGLLDSSRGYVRRRRAHPRISSTTNTTTL